MQKSTDQGVKPTLTRRARIKLNVRKCKENRPSCDYCSHRGLNCEWPDIQMICQVPQAKPKTKFGTIIRNATPVSVPVALQAEMPVFTMQDFRLFNHFIQTAYPHHPVGNDSVWTHEIPSLASDVGIPASFRKSPTLS